MNRSKRPWTCGGCALSTFAVLLVLFFITAITSWLWFQSSERKLAAQARSQIESLREQGIPVDNASLDKWYRSRTNGEDSQAWVRILNFVGSQEFYQKCLGVDIIDPKADGTGPSAEGWPNEAKWRELLNETRDLRMEIRTLAEKRVPVRFPIVFQSISTLLPDTQNIRNAARLVSVEFEVAFADGDSAAIREAIETQYELCIVNSHEPWLVSKLVTIALHGIAHENLKKAIEANRLDQKDLELLLPLLQSTPAKISQWREIIQGERAGILPVFEQPMDQLFGNITPQRKTPFGSSRPSAQDKLNFLKYMDRFETMDVSTIDKALDSAAAIEQDFAKERAQAGFLGIRNWIATGNLQPAIGAAVSALARDSMYRDQAMIAVAIRLFQHSHGKLPDDLSQLKEFQIDVSSMNPQGGKPYGYLKTGATAKLWGPLEDPSTRKITPTSDVPPEIPTNPDEYTASRIRRSLWIFGE